MRALRRLLNDVERSNRRNAFLKEGDRILVGLSGGPDSVALLYLLVKMREKLELRLTAAHLDHGFSSEGRRRAFFCEKLCRALNVPLVAESIDARAKARRAGRSLEDAAREERYAFFRRAARKAGARTVAVGHTLDDQAETVLHRILRGTGTKGLGGIPPVRQDGNLRIVRPLIGCRKKDLEAALREARVPYRRDPSNADPAHTRNRVRAKLIPLLECEFNPRASEALAALADAARDTQAFLEKATRAALRRAAVGRPRPGRVTLRVATLARLDRAVRAEALAQAFALCAGTAYGPGAAHLEALNALVAARRGQANLPSGITARRTSETLELWIE